MTKLKKYLEIMVVFIYTFFTMKIVWPILFIKIIDINDNLMALVNNSLLAFIFGIFLNTALIIYFKILPKKVEAILLVFYTLINFKLLSVLLFNFNETISSSILWGIKGPNYYGLFIGSFLNALIFFYWLRRDSKK
jgi:hypothetical protein